MHVIFVEPAFPGNQREFVRALHSVGAAVTGIGEAPLHALDDELKSWMVAYEQVGSVCNLQALHDAVRRAQGRGWIDRLEATVEAHVMFAAKVREACKIPGTSVRTATLCRDKPLMKEALRAAGVPCARSVGTSSPADVRDFVKEVGYPVILKPRDAAGAAGTYRADDDAGLEQAMVDCRLNDGASVAVEEFIEGHEGFYDTITIGGTIAHDFVSHYYPGVLEAMRTRWISPQLITSNRIGEENYDEVKRLGARVIEVLDIGTSATHMEWFYGPKGLVFSEIGCRPPGVLTWDLYSAANDMDTYREWANGIVHGRAGARPSRRFSAGLIALRPDRDGRISHVEGVDELFETWGEHVIDSHFPPPGSRTQPVESGYIGNAWVRMRHPDYDTLHSMLDRVGQVLQVRAG